MASQEEARAAGGGLLGEPGVSKPATETHVLAELARSDDA